MSEFDFLRQTTATAFLFPGQGSQQVGMGQDLAAAYPVAQRTLEEADDILGFKLSELCFLGPENALTATENAQPALLAVSIAYLRVLADAVPLAERDGAVFVAGHSLGEYTALVAAGSLEFADALRLVQTRGRLMQDAGTAVPGQMTAVLGLDAVAVAEICAAISADGDVVQIANDNCPGQLVISGDQAGIARAVAALTDAGARKVVPLAVSIAAHSPLMAPAATGLEAAIVASSIAPPVLPVIGNLLARPLTTPAEIREELTAQLTGQVRWTDSMRYRLAHGVTQFIEIGPGDVLTSLMKRIERSATRRAVNDVAGVQTLIAEWPPTPPL